MIDQYLVLTIIGIVILVIGIISLARKIKGGLILSLIGVLWLFTMGLYYAFAYAELYKPGQYPYPTANIIGIALLIIGLVLVLRYWARTGILRR